MSGSISSTTTPNTVKVSDVPTAQPAPVGTSESSSVTLTPQELKEQQVPNPVSWVNYYVLIGLNVDPNNLNPVLGHTRSDQYGKIPSFPDYQMIQVTPENSDTAAWEAYLNLSVATPLAISKGHLELGTPVIVDPAPSVVLQERMSSLMNAGQRYGWGQFTPWPDSATAYGKELAALQGKNPLASSDIPAIPADLVSYLT